MTMHPHPLPQALPPSGIHIFASQLHTHLSGRKVETMLVRGGHEVQLVNRDPHYSPHFQVCCIQDTASISLGSNPFPVLA